MKQNKTGAKTQQVARTHGTVTCTFIWVYPSWVGIRQEFLALVCILRRKL